MFWCLKAFQNDDSLQLFGDVLLKAFKQSSVMKITEAATGGIP